MSKYLWYYELSDGYIEHKSILNCRVVSTSNFVFAVFLFFSAPTFLSYKSCIPSVKFSGKSNDFNVNSLVKKTPRQNEVKFQNLLLFCLYLYHAVFCCCCCCCWVAFLFICSLWIKCFVHWQHFWHKNESSSNYHQIQLSKIGVQSSHSMPRLSNQVASL